MSISSRIRVIPDYPKPGILFRDITTLIKDPIGLRVTVNELLNRYSGMKFDKIAAIESRGFIIGAPLSYMLGVGFIPIRKEGKLPAETVRQEYGLEYGCDVIEIHKDAIEAGDKVLIVDDLLATGGTAAAAVSLVQLLGGEVIECAFVVDLPELGGRLRLESMGKKVFSLCEFEGK